MHERKRLIKYQRLAQQTKKIILQYLQKCFYDIQIAEMPTEVKNKKLSLSNLKRRQTTVYETSPLLIAENTSPGK